MPMTPTLFTPLTLRQLTLHNRVWVSPMCQYSVEQHDGIAVDWHRAHYGALARGGAGLVLTEATAVSPEGRISAWDLGLWDACHVPALARITEFAHQQGTSIGVQLSHAGRKASVCRPWDGGEFHRQAEGGWQTIGPSAVAFGDYPAPIAMTLDDIDRVVRDFRSAARRAVEAGFDVIEIHAAHGYLAHQFLSPIANARTDDYGGSLANRARFLLQIVREVRDVVGEELPLMVRLSATDWLKGGVTVDDIAQVSAWAFADGADFFDISTGGIEFAGLIPVQPGYQVAFAAAIAQQASVPTSAVGLIRQAAQAATIVASGQAQAVMVGRELLRDPHAPARWAAELGATTNMLPHQYERAPFR